jgi:branched-chain amino acid transport system substrate-binding protein
MTRYNRRTVLKASAAFAGASAIGFPAIVSGQTDKIKIGHLTPLTGFLGALGAYAQLGIKMAEEEINKAGGVIGRQLDVVSEDSVNPATAATKAQRMLEQDGVAVLMGEINSASALTIMQVAARNKKLFMQIGARSDALRGKNCNKYTFHVDIPNTVMVNAVGKALLRDNMVKDKKFFTLTADYIFGHDLLRAAKAFFAANQGNLIGDELVATDVTDFSPYLLKIRQAKPDVVCSNLAGNQVTTLVKQYAEFGLPIRSSASTSIQQMPGLRVKATSREPGRPSGITPSTFRPPRPSSTTSPRRTASRRRTMPGSNTSRSR